MTQQHGDRLTAVDASFLAQEGPTAHMHVGAVMIFDGPAPAYEDLADHVRKRLHLVPRFRQKLAFPPLETGRPLWIDDPNFNLEYHVRAHRAARARLGEAAARARRARALAGAGPLEAAVGDVARTGPRGRALRAALQDASRARRRRRRASTSPRCCSTCSRSPAEIAHADDAVGAARDAERARHGRARRPRRVVAAVRRRFARGRAPRRARPMRWRARARRSRASARSSGRG